MEVLDSFFGNVCELDLVFNFYKVSGFFMCFRGGGVEGDGMRGGGDIGWWGKSG